MNPTSLLDAYQEWVRSNAQLANNIEMGVRAITMLNMDPSSLFAVEAAYSASGVLSIIHQSALEARPQPQQQQRWNDDAVEDEYAKRQRTLQLLLRIIRESQCVGELLLRRVFLLHPNIATRAARAAAGSRYLAALQVYITVVELAKIGIKFAIHRDIWKHVGWQLIQFFGRRNTPSTSSPSIGSGSRATAAAMFGNSGGVTFASLISGLKRALGLAADSSSITIPHVINTTLSSSSSTTSTVDVLSRADRAGLWLDLVDMFKPLVMGLLLCRVWHRRSLLHRAWMIWIAGLVYEFAAGILQSLLQRHRSAFMLRDGSLVTSLAESASGRGRPFAIGCHLLRYPFFNTIVEPELRQRLLSEQSWLSRIPLVSGFVQGWIAYMLEVQKRCVLYTSGA